MILVGDIGGTHARIALARTEGTSIRIDRARAFESAEYPGLVEVLDDFLGGETPPDLEGAAFGIAGPIEDGKCLATNLPWHIHGRDIGRRFGIDRVVLLNDLEAAAYGVEALEPEDMIVVNEGVGLDAASGNRAVVSAGTGLGEAGMYWDGAHHHPFATEGGHTDFAPRNTLEFELLQFLIEKHGRVSYERVLSGPGLLNIYDFFAQTGRYEEDAAFERALRDADDRGRVISDAALSGSSARCAAVLELFMTLYGSEVGNVILKHLATGGVWLGGGIIGSLAPRMRGFDAFLGAMTRKGRLSPLVGQTPVIAILDGSIALRGAAVSALRADGVRCPSPTR